MQFSIILDENEVKVTPIKLAESIIRMYEDDLTLDKKDLRELVAYLSVYNDYNGGRKDK